MPAQYVEEVNNFRYRREFHLSYREFLNEPIDEVRRWAIISELDEVRAKLERDKTK